MRTTIQVAAEGIVDEAVLRRLIAHAGGQTGTVYGRNGKAALREKIRGYNNAARFTPWVVLVDLDNDADCAPSMRNVWVPVPAPNLCFRIAVREVEAWLMADRQTLARYLSVKAGNVPVEPEKFERPKDAMVNLARGSRSRDIHSDIVPQENSGRRVGPAYASRLVEYIRERWRPEVAAQHAESLRRAINCLITLARTGDGNRHAPTVRKGKRNPG